MDLRSLFHLNHSVGIPYSIFVPSFVVTPPFRRCRDQSAYDVGRFFFWLPQRGILYMCFSWFHSPTDVLATLCRSSDNRTEMLSKFFYPSFNYASCKKYIFSHPIFRQIVLCHYGILGLKFISTLCNQWISTLHTLYQSSIMEESESCSIIICNTLAHVKSFFNFIDLNFKAHPASCLFNDAIRRLRG